MVRLGLAFIRAFHPEEDPAERRQLDAWLADHGPVRLTRK
jgi:hypothetical protein